MWLQDPGSRGPLSHTFKCLSVYVCVAESPKDEVWSRYRLTYRTPPSPTFPSQPALLNSEAGKKANPAPESPVRVSIFDVYRSLRTLVRVPDTSWHRARFLSAPPSSSCLPLLHTSPPLSGAEVKIDECSPAWRLLLSSLSIRARCKSRNDPSLLLWDILRTHPISYLNTLLDAQSYS